MFQTILKSHNFLDSFGLNETVANNTILSSLESNVGINLLIWLILIFTPVLSILFTPNLLMTMTSITALFVLLCELRLRFSKTKDDFKKKHYWDSVIHRLARFWDVYGSIWYGYEVIGLESIPCEGPALMIYYHGGVSLDHTFLMAKYFLYTKRLIHSVVHNYFFKVPGLKFALEVVQASPGSRSNCINVLKSGNLLFLAPGGTREGQFSDENYRLIWGKGVGFAKIAIETHVPIIPIFTQNIREAFCSVKFGRNVLRRFFERTKIPCVPVWGGFPVKLRTIIGKPIQFDPSVSAEELAQKTSLAIEELIRKNQRIPGSIPKAIIDRFYSYPKEKLY